MLTIDLPTARRFILGKQGLWPGRRWQGVEGTAQAMTAMEYLQLDPLQIVARSQDLALHSRVLDYAPERWEEVTYTQRHFFDWGGWLAVRPMTELPFWRTVMRREQAHQPHLRAVAHDHAEAIVEMREILRARGTVSNRDFTMAERRRTHSYRGRKDSALALYHLWRAGEVMTHHRERFERVYALTETVAPAHLVCARTDDEVDRFLVKKEIAFNGIARIARTGDSYGRGEPDRAAQRVLGALLDSGEIVEVKVEGWKAVHYMHAGDAEALGAVAAGRVPAAWQPVASSTEEEVVFLAPLDPVSARGRARLLFGFDYVWEVYKPEPQRKFGYYTLPILWGDRLVARFDSRLERASNTLVILGFWLEDDRLGQDKAFAAALGRGFARFVTFLGAGTLDAAAVGEARLRRAVDGAEAIGFA